MGLDGGADSTGGADRTDDEWRNADDGDEPRVDVVRVPFQASAQASPNQIAVPASPRQPTRDHSRAGRPVDLWVHELCLESSLGHPFLNRGCRYVCVGFVIWIKSEGVT